MTLISLLWIGPAKGFVVALSEDPKVDIVWQPGVPEPLPPCDAVVLDAAGPATCAYLSRHGERKAPVLVVAENPGPGEAEAWLARGASAVAPRPPSGDARAADALVDRLRELSRPGDTTAQIEPASGAPVVRDARMQRVLVLARRAASSRAHVLLTGETGAGKEIVAREIHLQSARARGPFVALNCAALPDTLLESELLGHVRGAFTGAERDHKGVFEEAHGGTLFLDEVGETSPSFQRKLLRVLQDRVIRPLGSSRTRAVDVRIVAATHRDLVAEAARGGFREDLYYRLAVFPIAIPPLRERPEDILALSDHFLRHHGSAEGKPGCRIGKAAARLLAAHAWPGNVRELENEIQRALVLAAPGGTLGVEHFSKQLGAGPPPLAPELVTPRADESLHVTLARVEAWLIRHALEHNQGRRAETARRLGVTREGLYKKMKRLGIE